MPALLWESTASVDLADVVTNDYKNAKDPTHPSTGGTFLVSLRDRIAVDIGAKELPVAVRHLQVEDRQRILAPLKSILEDPGIRSAYFPGIEQFVMEVWDGRKHNRPPRSYDHLFCSELLAFTLIRMGLLSEDHVPNYYEPKSYSSQNPEGIPLLRGARLEVERCIDRLT